MSRLLDGFDQAWRWWTFLCVSVLVGGIVFAVFALAAQSRQDAAFVRTELRPLARRVEAFRDARGRLPTDAEFAGWAAMGDREKRAEYYPEKPRFATEWGTPGRDFIVGAWRGQWMHYYQSWNGKDFAGEIGPLIKTSPPPR